MSSMRGIRRKKSSLSEVKLAVIGASGVGKTAMTVRFLTKRYIGEYDHQNEGRYKHEALVDGDPILFEVLDTCCPNKGADLCSAENFLWADGLLLVFSVTDRVSFATLRAWAMCRWRDMASTLPISTPPAVLVASKADMMHLRQVSQQDGEALARELECPYFEVSAAENAAPVTAVFHELSRLVSSARKQSKQSLLGRVLGAGKSRTYARGKSDSALP